MTTEPHDDGGRPDRSPPDAPSADALPALQERLRIAEEALTAIRQGDVDAVVVRGARGSEVYTRRGADSNYRVLFEQLHDGAAMLSADGDILYCNRQLADWFGLPIDEVIGTPLASHLGGRWRAVVARALSAAAAGHAIAEVETRSVAGGAGIPLQLSCNAMPPGSCARVGLIATDLRPRRDAAALREQQARLEELVEARTAELRHALAAAEAAGEAKTRFLANMSHEMRTPLHAILGLTHLALLDPLPAAQRERLDRVSDAGEHLLRLINDILDLSRIEASALSLVSEVFAPAVVLRQVEGMLREQAREKGLALITAVDPGLPQALRGDGTRLLQGMLNLASNAVKFTEHGSVVLRLRCFGYESGEVPLRFEVEDTGPGVPPEVRERLFRPFEQGDSSTTRRHGGSGLGLAITRRLAESMSGQCDYEPRPGGGSMFWLTAVLTRVAEDETAVLRSKEPAATPVAGSGTPDRRVLVVEDEPISGQVTQGLLEARGLQVDVVPDVSTAVEHWRQQPPYDLVVLDLQMPGVDGVAAVELIRGAAPAARAVPIVALTASVLPGDRERCLGAGMSAFLTKPVDPELLHETVQRWLAPAAADAGSPGPMPRVRTDQVA